MARKRRDILAPRDLYTLAALLLFIAQGVLFRRFSFDDTYICYRYARHLGEGLGPVMNAGERVEGVSNLPWTGLLGLFAAVDLEPHSVGPVLSFLCGLALVIVVSEWAARLIDDPRAGGPTALFLSAFAPLAVWSVSGLETVAFTLLLTLLFWRAHHERAAQAAGWGTGLLLGAVASMRPEGLAYAAVLAWAAPRAWRWWGTVAVGAAVWIVPLEAFRLLYYDAWLPNTVHAKATLGDAALVSGAAYVGKMMLTAAPGWLAAVRVPRAALVAPGGSLLAGWLVTHLLLTLASGGERVPGYRFLVPLLPALAIALEVLLRHARTHGLPAGRVFTAAAVSTLVLGALVAVRPALLDPALSALVGVLRTHRDAAAHLERLHAEARFAGVMLSAMAGVALFVLRLRRSLTALEPVEGSRTTRAPLGRVVHEAPEARRAMLFTLACVLVLVVLPTFQDPMLRAARQPDPAVRFGRPVGLWLAEHYDADTRVATNAAGALPYFSRLPTLDMLGLTDRHIARVAPDRTQWTGHEKGDGAYVLSREPDIIVFGGPEGSVTPWPFPGDAQIAASDAFRTHYALRRVALDGFEFVYYERRGTERAASAVGVMHRDAREGVRRSP